MKGITTLIKLHKRALDGLRRKMASLENQKARLLQASKKLDDELQQEIAAASRQPEMSGFFGGFAKRIRNRQDDIAREIKKLDAAMTKLQEEIAEAFRELKKFEIAQENAKKRAQEEEKRKETILLDEVAGQQHRRKEQIDT